MSDVSDSENSKLLEFTRMFWTSFCANDFTSVEALLAPDCCIHTSFAQDDVGMSGVEACAAYLHDIYTKMKLPGSRLDMTQMHHLRLMPNCKQTRFMINGKPGYISSNMGFAVDWQLEMIICLVVVKNTSASMFLSALSGQPVLPEEDTSWGKSIFSKMSVSTDMPSGAATAGSGGSSGSGATGSGIRTVSTNSRRRLEDTLFPPYLHPKPPPVPPTVTVTILECTNLKSRLVRVISRPVSAFVSVSLGAITRRTETVKYNNYPCFDSTNAFLFEISDHDREDGVLRFKVIDEHVINDDILSETEVPLASLRAAVDHSSPYEIKLPLVLGETHYGLALTSNNVIDDEPPLLRVRINKVDAMQWWANKEVSLRAAQQEQMESDGLGGESTGPGTAAGGGRPPLGSSTLPVESVRGSSKSRRSSLGAFGALLGGSDAEEPGGSMGDVVPKSQWVDDKHVILCME